MAELEVHLHSFITCAICVVKWSVLCPVCFLPWEELPLPSEWETELVPWPLTTFRTEMSVTSISNVMKIPSTLLEFSMVTDRHDETNGSFFQLKSWVCYSVWLFRSYVSTAQPNYLTNSMEQSSFENSVVLQLVKKFPAFYGMRSFITAITTARHLCLSWARLIQSMSPSHFFQIHFNIIPPFIPKSFKCFLFPWYFLTKPCVHLSSPPYLLHAPPISFFLIWSVE